MTLGQFAIAVGASRRWVLNALTRLRLKRRYDEPLARRLALARHVTAHTGMSLKRSYALAGRALKEAELTGIWTLESDDGSVVLAVNMPRFFTAYGARLSLARSNYGEKARGRRPRRRGSAVERAKKYGIDVTLLDSQLRLTPDERLRRLDEWVTTLKSMRRVAEP